MKKLFVTDLDGTLLNDEKIIPYSTQKVIEEFSIKNDFVIATGRNLTMIKSILKDLTTVSKVICSGGAVIYDIESQEVLFEKSHNRLTIEKIIEISEQYNVPINLYSKEKIYYFKKGIRIEQLLKKNEQLENEEQIKLQQIKNVQEIKESINKIVFVFQEEEIRLKNEVRNKCKEYNLNCLFSASNLLDILPIGVNKATAIKYLKEKEEYKLTIAAGDNENDLSMLEDVDISVAVENATKDIRTNASIITASNNQKGIEKILQLIN